MKLKNTKNPRPVPSAKKSVIGTGPEGTKTAFTLVELIVVITILAILGTIAFISLQGYSAQSRDSVRITDISSMKTSLELFQLDAGKYPLPTDGTEITFSGGLTWIQGYFGDSTYKNVGKLDQIPLDPLTDKKYVYSTTNTRQEFQLAGVMEGEEVTLNQLTQTNAGEKTALVKISGNYNGKLLKVSTGGTDYVLAIPSILTSSGDTDIVTIVTNNTLSYNGYKNLPIQYEGGKYNVNGDSLNLMNPSSLVVFSGSISILSSAEQAGIDARLGLLTNMQSAYTGTTIKNIGAIARILSTESTDSDATELLTSNIVSNNLGGSIITDSSSNNDSGESSIPVADFILSSTDCTNAGWIWINPATDVYIGSTQGSGFCISPRIGDFGNTGNANEGISWNGWGNVVASYFSGWDSTGIDDGANPYGEYGQTRRLDGQTSYDCKALGDSLTDFDTNDDIVGRMTWLVTNKASLVELQNVEWVTGLSLAGGQSVPALFLSDCIDGLKDLGLTMNYIDNSNNIENITYSQYNEEKTTADQSGTLNGCEVLSNLDEDSDCVIYQNRQKYLTAWTQKKGSHLPSAFSYIVNGKTSANDIDGDFLSGIDRGEYQVACDSGNLGSVTYSTNQYIGSSEDLGNERIWLSAIGDEDGTGWGHTARILGESGCGNQERTDIGRHGGSMSARFIIRP